MSEERGKLYWFRLESKEFTNKNTSRLRQICKKRKCIGELFMMPILNC